MVETCLIWPKSHCDSKIGNPASGYEINSSRAGGIYSLSATLLATDEFQKLTIEEKVKLTDYIVEKNDVGEVASFGSSQVQEILLRAKRTTEHRELAFLKLVYTRDPNLMARVPLAISDGYTNPQLLGYGHEKIRKLNNSINEFIARTSSRNVEDVHNLAEGLIGSGKLDNKSTKTSYIL